MNRVELVGRLTRDPEQRNAGETAVVNFTIAIDRPTKAGAEKQADFPRVTVFGKRAENCMKYLSKGLLVSICGRIQTGSYKKDGVTIYTTDVIADDVGFLEWKDKGQNGNNQAAAAAPAQAAAAPAPDDYQAAFEEAPNVDDDF